MDVNILKALGLNAEGTKMSRHGGSGFSSTFKLTATVGGKEKRFFVKVGTGKDAELMFKGKSTICMLRIKSKLEGANPA